MSPTVWSVCPCVQLQHPSLSTRLGALDRTPLPSHLTVCKFVVDALAAVACERQSPVVNRVRVVTLQREWEWLRRRAVSVLQAVHDANAAHCDRITVELRLHIVRALRGVVAATDGSSMHRFSKHVLKQVGSHAGPTSTHGHVHVYVHVHAHVHVLVHVHTEHT